MIKRVFRCTSAYGPEAWHWELVRKGQVIAAGKRESRVLARMAADRRREEIQA